MRKIFFTGILFIILYLASMCNKPSNYYSAPFLNNAETAKPGRVDSLTILPGRNRALLRFIVSPDRRVTKVRISYSSSLSPDVKTSFVTITDQDYGSRKEVAIDNLPEATLIANVVSFSNNGDSSTVAQVAGTIYGDRYIASLYNRVYQNMTTVSGVKYMNFINESAKPQDSTVFYPLQKTVVTYPKASGGTNTFQISAFTNSVPVPDIAATGTIKLYSLFKPVQSSIDIFQSATLSVNF